MKKGQSKARLLMFIVISVFCLGWITNDVISLIDQKISKDKPLGNQSNEKLSPSDWISNEDVHVYSDKVVIDLKDAQWAVFTDTNSMDPLLDSDSNGIEVVPQSADQISVGDIISYKSQYSTGTIIHRVIEKGVDDQGVYFIVKGDNNPSQDPGKIRFDQVQRVLVGVLY